MEHRNTFQSNAKSDSVEYLGAVCHGWIACHGKAHMAKHDLDTAQNVEHIFRRAALAVCLVTLVILHGVAYPELRSTALSSA